MGYSWLIILLLVSGVQLNDDKRPYSQTMVFPVIIYRHESWTIKKAAAAKSLQSCPTLCDPIYGSPQGSPVPGILQVRTLEWVAISSSNAWKWKVKVRSLSRVQLWATPWTQWSLPGSSVHGIFQARVLEWGAIAFSKRMVDSFWYLAKLIQLCKV